MENEYEKKSKGKKPKKVIDEAENESSITIDGKKVNLKSIEFEGPANDKQASYAEFEDGTELEDYELDELNDNYYRELNYIASDKASDLVK